MRFLFVATALAVVACGRHEVRFGTEEYWRLPAEARQGPRAAYLKRQEERASRLAARCRALGTVEAHVVASQYALWTEWVVRGEGDPLEAEHVLTLWAKAYSVARKHRRGAPRTVDDLRRWLEARQNPVTGSWAPPEAPLWLAVGETGEALRLLASGDTVSFREVPMFLGILRTPAAASEVLSTTYRVASRAGLEAPIRHLAWLPWLRWVARDQVEWDPSWETGFRTHCASLLLDEGTGGYRCVEGRGMDLVTTYRLVRGWSRGQRPATWVPRPQTMVATILAWADTLSAHRWPEAVALLVGSMADLDAPTRARACEVVQRWVEAVSTGARQRGSVSVSGYRVWEEVGPSSVRLWVREAGCPLDFSVLDLPSQALGGRLPTLEDLEREVLRGRVRAEH